MLQPCHSALKVPFSLNICSETYSTGLFLILHVVYVASPETLIEVRAGWTS